MDERPPSLTDPSTADTSFTKGTNSGQPVNRELHHSAAPHSKKWKDYLFEFLMLFLAVAAGFFMENQREHYVEGRRVKEYAHSLIHDLSEDTIMVEETIERIRISIRNIEIFAAFVKGKELKDLSNIDLYARTIFLDGYRPYTWNRATIDQIKSSGSLRYFTNDTIINDISNYDAFTRHMDEDYIGDQGRSDRTLELKSKIIDLNYPDSLLNLLRSKKDSAIHPEYYLEQSDPGHALLTKDLNEIKMLANEKLVIKYHLITRMKEELPLLVRDGTRLIQSLKKEYHWE